MRDAADPGTDLAPATPLVGRDRELGLLRGWLAAALAGRGSLALVGGEAGIGKTALGEAVCAEAAVRGALVLVGRCYDLSETPPYGPWREALAARGQEPGDWPPPPDLAGGAGTGSQAALFAAVRDYLAALAARRPLVLLLDDLHWADPASLDLLRVVARGLGDLAVLLLATYRADEVAHGHPLYARLPALVREARPARLDLRPLDGAGLQALVAGRYPLDPADEARLVAYLRARTEGNPFFAGELLRTLEEEGTLRRADAGWALGDLARVGVPPLLRQVIDARVDRLGAAARDLLAAAAVVGQELPLDLWQAVAGADEDALAAAVERAAEARLLAEAPDGLAVRFAHALVREALYEGLLGPRRRALHRRAGEALLAGPAPDPDAVAEHFRRAGDDRAAEWLIEAGERARRAYAWLTAADRFAAALALMEARGADAGARGWLLLRLALLRRYVDPRRGLAEMEGAARLAAAAGDRGLATGCRFLGGLLRCLAGDLRRGLGEMAAGCDAYDALAPADRERWRQVVADGGHREALALWLAAAGRFAEALAQAEAGDAVRPPPAAGQLAGSLVRTTAYADGRQGLGVAHAALGRPAEAQRALAEARAAYRAGGESLLVVSTAWRELARVVLPYRADRPAERRALAAEAEEAWRQAGGAAAELPPRFAWLPLLVLDGAWAEARGLAVVAAAPGGEAGARAIPPAVRAIAKSLLALLARERGEPALAWRPVRAELPDGPATAPGDAMFLDTLALQRLAAALCLDVGDPPRARAWLEAHDRWLDWNGTVLGRAEGALGWAAYHRAAGDLATARQHAETALAHATEPRQPLALLAAHRALGELATEAGRHADAAAHLDTALALADACAAPYERALTLLELAELRAAEGKVEEARTLLAEVCAICELLGAKPTLERATALETKLAAAPAPRPFGLSPRELEVLGLLADGLTDRQIAAALTISPHTAMRHVAGILTKLGVPSRTAAAALAVRHGLR
ncbi:MAG TPA: AAA family ATPase [Thermomicrobiales bacterium]|nr:AAA family ATPase [Thermomicrobiales bacterium]